MYKSLILFHSIKFRQNVQEKHSRTLKPSKRRDENCDPIRMKLYHRLLSTSGSPGGGYLVPVPGISFSVPLLDCSPRLTSFILVSLMKQISNCSMQRALITLSAFLFLYYWTVRPSSYWYPLHNFTTRVHQLRSNSNRLFFFYVSSLLFLNSNFWRGPVRPLKIPVHFLLGTRYRLSALSTQYLNPTITKNHTSDFFVSRSLAPRWISAFSPCQFTKVPEYRGYSNGTRQRKSTVSGFITDLTYPVKNVSRLVWIFSYSLPTHTHLVLNHLEWSGLWTLELYSDRNGCHNPLSAIIFTFFFYPGEMIRRNDDDCIFIFFLLSYRTIQHKRTHHITI